MSIQALSNFFEQSVPLGVVFLVVYLVRMGRDVKYINEKLDNHITDTDKKIDSLRGEVKEVRQEVKEVSKEFIRVNGKLDKILSK